MDTPVALHMKQMMQAHAEILGPLVMLGGAKHPAWNGLRMQKGTGAGAPEGQRDSHALGLGEVEHAIEALHLGSIKMETGRVRGQRAGIVVLRFVPLRQNHHTQFGRPQQTETAQHHTVPILSTRTIIGRHVLGQEMRVQFDAHSVQHIRQSVAHTKCKHRLRITEKRA